MSLSLPDQLTDQRVITHSLMKTFRRCPRAALYKYQESLSPRVISKPLKRGKWFHALLEAYYQGEDWKAVHKKYVHEFSQLFDEEKDSLGDLPSEMVRLMRSYLWHYRNDESWKVHEVELTIEQELPNGFLYRGRVDMLVETLDGLYVVDHKTHANLPSHAFRVLDQQSVLYMWAARKNKIPVQGFIWNYIKTNGPKRVRLTQRGSIAKNQGATDYPTAFMSLKQAGVDPKEFKDFLRPLAQMRYVQGEIQTSPFFQRQEFEKNNLMIKRAVKEAIHTSDRYGDYDFSDKDAVERVVERSCDWCGYQNLCMTELIGGNVAQVKRQGYIEQDAHAYYNEDLKRETRGD